MGWTNRHSGTIRPFVYHVGEEVVARMASTEVYNVERGSIVPPFLNPSWAIATIIEVTLKDGASAYVLRFRYGIARCVCVVPESAIEGTA